MPDIMEIIDGREKQKTPKNRTKQRSTANYSKSVRAKWFCWAFKLSFVQLISKAFFIFKSNLELALSLILKERELYESKHISVECRCLKTCNLLSFFVCFSILDLK